MNVVILDEIKDRTSVVNEIRNCTGPKIDEIVVHVMKLKIPPIEQKY